MITDSLFKIGTSHKVCQDYALHSSDFVLMSDGCSSSADTDIGSRLLCLAAKSVLKPVDTSIDAYWLWFSDILIQLVKYKHTLQLQDSVFDATLGGIFNKTAFLYGDGFIIAVFSDRIEVKKIDYAENYPIYLSYSLNLKRLENVSAIKTNIKTVNTQVFDLNFNLLNETKEEIDGAFFLKTCGDDVKMLMVCSDGLASFQEKVVTDTYSGFKPIDFKRILPNLLAIKVKSAGFMMRRFDRFMLEMEKVSINHYDDFSIGTIIYETN